MGSECHDVSSTPPKLSLFSLTINRAVEQTGMLTPPIKTKASVPFQWEEVPGKPRRPFCVDDDGDSKPNKSVVKCLELPPRLFTEPRSMPSPTTVIDGPYGGGRGGGSGRYGLGLMRKGGRWSSFRSQAGEKERVLFGSSRWGSNSRKKKKKEEEEEEVGDGGGFDFLFSDVKSEEDDNSRYSRDGTKVKITRVKNRSLSFRSSSTTKSKSNHFLMSIYESFKHVVPLSWSRRSSRN